MTRSEEATVYKMALLLTLDDRGAHESHNYNQITMHDNGHCTVGRLGQAGG